MVALTLSDIAVVLTVSFIGFMITKRAIPQTAQVLFQRGIYGIDINKTTPELRAEFREAKKATEFPESMKKYVVPESLGVIVGPIYLCTATVLLVFFGHGLSKSHAALSSIAFALLLGFVDDVLDVRWRYKVTFSFFGTLPLLASYDGPTAIMMPSQIRDMIGTTYIEFGTFYLVVMALLCVFCTNSINILAGVNGVEVGQSLVIAVAQATHNVVQIYRGVDDKSSSHALSFILLCPFIACSFALWQKNKYPSQVFVGDSYTYFAGMTLAVAGITGTYSKTMVLFFIPQLFNFVLSIPQLLNIVPCPRHRVPTWNMKTNLLENSKNYTILNFILFFTGPLHERTLTTVTLFVQVVCCILGFGVRYLMAGQFFDRVV